MKLRPRCFPTKPLSYWLLALASIILGMQCGKSLERHGVWINLRYRLYQAFERAVPHPPSPKRTVLVLIDDEEYWKGPLARRIPIHRDYLADLLRSVSACNPAVIALDFDLRSPVADGTLRDNHEYAGETAYFLAAVSDVSVRQPVILPATLGTYRNGHYQLESAVYSGGITLEKGRVQTGYIQIPPDARKVPMRVKLLGGGYLDSFAESIVRALNESLLADIHQGDLLPFGTFMKEKQFQSVLAHDLLQKPNQVLCAPLRHNIVIVGSTWHQYSFDSGGWTDWHISPVGYMHGAFMHANYVEALLEPSRIYWPLGEKYCDGIDFFFSSIVAVVLALDRSSLRKFLYVGSLCTGMMLVSYLFWQNLGIFFDFFFPVVFLVVHAVGDFFFREFLPDARLGRKMRRL